MSNYIYFKDIKPDDMRVLVFQFLEEQGKPDIQYKDWNNLKLPLIYIPLKNIGKPKSLDLNRGKGYALNMSGEELPPIIVAYNEVLDGTHRLWLAHREKKDFIKAIDLTKFLNTVPSGEGIASVTKTAKQESITDNETTVEKRDPKKQVKADDLSDFLKKLDDEKIKWEFVSIPVGEIDPEQKEIKREKVDAIKESLDKGEELKPCYVNKDNNMCDGHHRMIAVMEKYGEDYHLPCVRIDSDTDTIFKLMEGMNDSKRKEASLDKKVHLFFNDQTAPINWKKWMEGSNPNFVIDFPQTLCWHSINDKEVSSNLNDITCKKCLQIYNLNQEKKKKSTLTWDLLKKMSQEEQIDLKNLKTTDGYSIDIDLSKVPDKKHIQNYLKLFINDTFNIDGYSYDHLVREDRNRVLNYFNNIRKGIQKESILKFSGLTEDYIKLFYELEYKISRLRLKNEDHPKLYEWENKLGQVCDKLLTLMRRSVEEYIYYLGNSWEDEHDEVTFDNSWEFKNANKILKIFNKVQSLKEKILAVNAGLIWHHSGSSMLGEIENTIGAEDFDRHEVKQLLTDLSNGKYVPKWDRELEKIH